jgi:hypothetical protein
MILKGIGKIDGDGWKDTTRKGEVIFAYKPTLPKPYAEGQHERVGNIGWTASEKQYDFVPASIWEIIRLLPAILRDAHHRRRYYAFRKPC